jgi:hypothetical protein
MYINNSFQILVRTMYDSMEPETKRSNSNSNIRNGNALLLTYCYCYFNFGTIILYSTVVVRWWSWEWRWRWLWGVRESSQHCDWGAVLAKGFSNDTTFHVGPNNCSPSSPPKTKLAIADTDSQWQGLRCTGKRIKLHACSIHNLYTILLGHEP